MKILLCACMCSTGFSISGPEREGHGNLSGQVASGKCRFFQQENIAVDFDERGFCDYTPVQERIDPKEKIIYYVKHPMNMWRRMVWKVMQWPKQIYWAVTLKSKILPLYGQLKRHGGNGVFDTLGKSCF